MSDIPAKLAKWTHADYPNEWPAVKAWLLDPASWALVIGGPFGTGKTCLACAIVAAWRLKYPQPRSAAFVVVKAWLEHATREAMHTEDGWYTRMLETVPLLAIDDLDKRRVSDFSRDVVCGLLETREKRDRKTIITSNLDLREIGLLYGGHIESRLGTERGGTLITMTERPGAGRKD